MTTAIIGAMEQEVVALRDLIDNCDTYSFAGCEFYSGEINNHPVVVTRSGIGKVAAAIATTVLLQRYQPTQVINTGSAGGFDPALKVGDVVISNELRYHDVDLTAFSYEMGQLPANPAAYKADTTLINIAEQAATQFSGHQTVRGLICTGDIFMADPERVAKARADFPTMAAVEMEGAAIAQVCHLAEVPFVVIRSLSDIAGKESPSSFDEFLETAAKHSTALVLAMLEKLTK
ncbi:5'-methylthioadenosine/S-adenosylhomocysteine nucleosidase [Agarivorans sp. TSD2052]|uniref:5'-methylthioadenosine/S-adenosylhomocysteine nucleosidase n=1 Tax=Agarivorans sp. TSD2052 TaxID=2937286 RepID=UPI00200DD026|nr:5'-methylthioadenosine/S-adenosylhomocysteine nucleosidase [Agarivorans sp. TSD2052]UPW19260.1 5'-methylthioadenosine/S-adenosylhomocysteine nucleosidase [Agarivorans sp. TSD2052]